MICGVDLPLGGKVAFAEQMTDEGAVLVSLSGIRPLISQPAADSFPPKGKLIDKLQFKLLHA